MPTCKLCKKNVNKLVRCHIYPISMSKEIAGRPHCLVSMSMNEGNARANYAHGGIYDETTVCNSCELLFKNADDYAIEFRRSVLSLERAFKLPYKTSRFPSFKADSSMLHKFAMQTWLRSYLSDRYENQQVRDQKIASEVSQIMLLSKNTIETGRQVSYLFFKADVASFMASPVYYADAEFPLYSMWLPNMYIFIAASDEGLPPGFSEISLKIGE